MVPQSAEDGWTPISTGVIASCFFRLPITFVPGLQALPDLKQVWPLDVHIYTLFLLPAHCTEIDDGQAQKLRVFWGFPDRGSNSVNNVVMSTIWLLKRKALC
jgi:hypothetical protein